MRHSSSGALRRAHRAPLLRAALVLLPLAGCTDLAGYDLDRAFGAIPFLAVLREDVALDPHEAPRLPAPNTIPVASPNGGTAAVFTQLQLDSVAATVTNPLQPTPEVLALGQAEYLNQCSVCHGDQGEGSGTVVGPGKFPFAPALVGAGSTPRSPGYVYAVIQVGRGLMPPQGYKMTETEHWAVVSYVQQLQGRAGAAPAAATPAPVQAAPAQAAPAPATDPAAPAADSPAAPAATTGSR